MHEFDPPHHLLLASALARPGVDLATAWERIVDESGSGQRLATSARLNQLRPQLASRLAQAGGTFPAGCAGRVEVEDAARAHRGHSMLMAAELIKVLEALQADGIRAVPFKGPALATFIGEGSHAREMTDLDVLIDASHIPASAAALAALGYEPLLSPQAVASPWLARVTNELVFAGRQGATTLELHWRFGPGWFPAAVSAGHVLSRARARTFFKASILWPGDEDLLLLHVADAMKSGGAGLRWVADLAAILRACQIDWSEIRATAGHCEGLDSVRVAMALVEDLSRETAAAIGLASLAVELAPEARALARDARSNPRLRHAIRSIRRRLADDSRLGGPWRHFSWALEISDHPARTAGAILRYLLGPAQADLQSMPAAGLRDTQLRLRAARRRLGLAG